MVSVGVGVAWVELFVLWLFSDGLLSLLDLVDADENNSDGKELGQALSRHEYGPLACVLAD